MSPVAADALARRFVALADSKKAEDPVLLDMRDLVAYTDFLVIVTARNERQARAIVDEVRQVVKRESGLLPGGVDGGGDAGWTILDYLDVVLHVFTPEARAFYRLDELWGDVPVLEPEAIAG
jgi:ribosome-associated protein